MTHEPTHQSISIRETLTSIIIAFALAFVFRAFVVEAFVIPTGSMAPTLMGAHMRFRSPQTGYDWPVDPWDRKGEQPVPVQGTGKPIRVNDPMSGYPMSESGLRTHTGDRILVLKYLIPFGLKPTRFDAVVFKNPDEPQVNFIKRLIGLPGEQIALVDGDVFVREPAATPDDPAIASVWAQNGWKIARKWDSRDGMRSRRGLHLQTSVWQPIFSSEFAPLEPDLNAPGVRNRRFRTPWSGDGPAWNLAGASYRYSGSGTTALRWDTRIRPIVDRNAYNQARTESDSSKRDGWSTPLKPGKQFPVSDVRLRCGVEPVGPGLTATAIVETRGYVFRARFEHDAASIDMREPDGTWRNALGAGTVRGLLAPGRVTNLEFWHVDQALHVLVDGRHIASATYGDDWSPEDRVEHATGKPLSAILGQSDPAAGKNPLAAPSLYERAGPVIRWEFSGGPFTLHRVGLDRDLYYRPATRRSGAPGWSTHPSTTRTLTARQYFACGDNSANSSDGRMWESVDPWVAQIDDRRGIVPERLLIGKAFFVYFPSMQRGAVPVPSPDFGRLRWVW